MAVLDAEFIKALARILLDLQLQIVAFYDASDDLLAMLDIWYGPDLIDSVDWSKHCIWDEDSQACDLVQLS